MVGAGILFKPVFKFIKKFDEKHVHDAELKGMGPEIEYPVDLFLDYFKVLADSSEKEAGWKPLDARDWSGKKKKVKEWLTATGASAEWRCAEGNGSFDKARVKFTVDASLSTILSFIHNVKVSHKMGAGSFMCVIDKGED